MQEIMFEDIAIWILIGGAATLTGYSVRNHLARDKREKEIQGILTELEKNDSYSPVENPQDFIARFFQKENIEQVNRVIMKNIDNRPIHLADMAFRISSEPDLNINALESDVSRRMFKDVTLVMLPSKLAQDSAIVILTNTTYSDKFVKVPFRDNRVADPIPEVKEYLSIYTYNISENDVKRVISSETLDLIKQYWRDGLPLSGIIIVNGMLIVIHKRITEKESLLNAVSADERLAASLEN